MMILLIALIPAVIVFLVAVGTESKAKTTVAALIAAALGVFTGNPAYMVLDVAAVGFAYWLAMSVVWDTTKPKTSTTVATPAPTPVVNKADSDSYSAVVVIAVLGVFAYLSFSSSSSHRPPSEQTQSASTQPTAPVQKPYIAPQLSPVPPPDTVQKQPKRAPKAPLQRCLEIRSEDKMVACLERLN